jgi:hypothetical protein
MLNYCEEEALALMVIKRFTRVKGQKARAKRVVSEEKPMDAM